MKKGDISPVLVNIGFGNVVAVGKVVAIVTPGSAPMKRLREEAKKGGRLVDATEGRRTRSIIITDSNHIILSAIQAETITQRFLEGKEDLAGEEE
jgi:extracellular matrix regulatory protein A